jgi:L-alanine-DL-glutamate epimerase-like enolase superfamily enzyme
LTYIEWDEASTPGLDAPGYMLSEGYITVPDAPGFGLELDEAIFHRAVIESGFSLSL